MEKITSRQNKTVREAAALLSSAEERAARGEFLCEGARLCQDAARSGIEVLRCFVTAQALEKYAAYLRPVLERARQSYLVADHVAGLLSSTKSPQGVFCQCRWPQGLLAGDAAGGGSCAVLEDLQDRGNLGTILRSCDALGADGLILTGHGVDLYDPEVIVSSMGSFFRVPAVRAADNNSVFQFIESLRQRYPGFQVLGTTAHKQYPLYGQDLTGPVLLMVGNETQGLCYAFKEGCDKLVTIPMAETSYASSFNVACAATVMLYEVSRQRALNTP